MVREVTVAYTGYGRSPKLSLFHFPDSTSSADLVDALDALITEWAAWASDTYSAQIVPVGRRLNDVDGTLVQEFAISEAGPATPGTVGAEPLPDAISMLLRWNTGEVVAGRYLKGRTFMPGIASVYLANGNLAGSTVSSVTAAAQAFAGHVSAPSIWSRTHGVAHPISIGSCWSELATQRRRRG